MFPIESNSISVYPYRQAGSKIELLQLHRCQKDDLYAATWQPVYGAANKDESAVAAARRELLEETGISPSSMFMLEHLESFFFRPSNSILLLPVFAAEIEAGEEIVLDDEHDDFRWINEDEINEKFIWRSQRIALQVLIETLRIYPESIERLLV